MAALPVSQLESAESLEQLRWLENGLPIRMAVMTFDNLSIDTPDDLVRAERFLETRNKNDKP